MQENWLPLIRKVSIDFTAAFIATVGIVGSSAPAEADHTNRTKEVTMLARGAEDGVVISVESTNWSGGRPQDISTLLGNVAQHLTKHLRDPLDAVIKVNYWPNYPMILMRLPGQTSYTILLTANGRLWAQFSYQFAHEFCHLLSGYEQLHESANNWFHESICEMASLFTLRSMGKSWTENPPYPNWHDYARHLTQYAENVADTVMAETPTEDAFSVWLRMHEAEGRQDPYKREGNRIVALRMLPIFEQAPQAWNAVRSLPGASPVWRW